VNTENDAVGLEQVPTGIEGLDTVLRGGLLRGGVYIVQGTPGAGKTILANEICFRRVAAGEKAIYVTLLAESHTRMLQHLRPLSFFDESVIPSKLYYVSAFRTLEEEGLKGLVALLRREIKGQSAGLLILDGLVAAEESAGTNREFKKFIHEMQSHASSQGCTVLLLTSGGAGDVRAEHTMVDGLIELEDSLHGVRTERTLLVRKFRGAAVRRGRHTYRINNDGIVLFPRLEVANGATPRYEGIELQSRLVTGVKGFDAMLQGGIPAASTTAVVGSSGVGKTTFGLHFLARSTPKEPGLMFSFFETPSRLCEKAQLLGIDLAGLCDRRDVELLWQVQGENLIDELSDRLLRAVRRRRVKRLVIDGLSGFIEAATDQERVNRHLACLTNELRVEGVTTYINVETKELLGSQLQLPVTGLSALVENMVVLRFVERNSCLSRMLSIVKVRDSDYDIKLRQFEITDGGILIGEPFYGTEGAMTGITHAAARPAARRSKTPSRKRR
jgi:circadian clock protein KaiC